MPRLARRLSAALAVATALTAAPSAGAAVPLTDLGDPAGPLTRVAIGAAVHLWYTLKNAFRRALAEIRARQDTAAMAGAAPRHGFAVEPQLELAAAPEAVRREPVIVGERHSPGIHSAPVISRRALGRVIW